MSSMKKMTEAVKKELPNLIAFGSNVDTLEPLVEPQLATSLRINIRDTRMRGTGAGDSR